MADVTDPNEVVCDESLLDALGYCNGDATLDCSGVNYYSPSNEDGNTVQGNFYYNSPCNPLSLDNWGACCGCTDPNACSALGPLCFYDYGCGCSDNPISPDSCGNCTGCTGNRCDCGCASYDIFGYCIDYSYCFCGCFDHKACSNQNCGTSQNAPLPIDGDTCCTYADLLGVCGGSSTYIDSAGTICELVFSFVPPFTWTPSVDALDICNGTCNDSSACGEDSSGCIYRNPDQSCVRPLVFTNTHSDNLSDVENWSGGVLPISTDNVRIEGVVYQDSGKIGEAGFASVFVAPTGLICSGVTITTNHLSNNSQFTGGYAEKYYTEGVFDSGINGLYFNYYPPTGYALHINGITNEFFTGGFNGVYYVLGVENTSYNGSAQNYSVVNGAVVNSTATFVNGVIQSAPNTQQTNPDELVFSLIGLPWMIQSDAPDIARIIGLPAFIKL